MTTLQEFTAALKPGKKVTITNHFITRPDHPCFGTRTETIESVNTCRAYFDGQKEGNYLDIPKSYNLKKQQDTFAIYGFPNPESLFLTVRIHEGE